MKLSDVWKAYDASAGPKFPGDMERIKAFVAGAAAAVELLRSGVTLADLEREVKGAGAAWREAKKSGIIR